MAPAFSTAHTVTSTTQRIQSRGRSPRTICTGAPTFSVDRGRAGVEARPYGEWLRGLTGNVIALHPRCTNPSVTALRAATAPLSGEPRAWEKTCGVYAFVYHDAATYVSLSPVRGGVLDAPRSRDCRGGLDALVRRDRQHPRHPRRARLPPPPTYHIPRIPARAPFCPGAPALSVNPRRAGAEGKPLRRGRGARRARKKDRSADRSFFV